MIVLKFGGTSVQDAEHMNRVIEITRKQIDRTPLLISSAMSKITDSLVEITRISEKGSKDDCFAVLDEIIRRHEDTAKAFLSGDNLTEALDSLNLYFDEMRAFVTGLIMLRECSLRSQDTLLSYGELLSTTLLYYRCKEQGIDSQLLDSRDLVVTDETFTSAVPFTDITYKNIKSKVKPRTGAITIGQGFIARTKNGAVSTLGRGGSDYSATLFGAALKAEEVQIWTDVDGIMSSDPRIVDNARTIDKISYNEAAELAYFGAKVVHPSTIQPAVELGIPVLVKNTMNPEGNFTAIIGESEKQGLRAIAGKKNITLLNVSSSRMLNAYGFLNRIFSIFDKYRTPVDLIATSEVSVSMTIDDSASIKEIIKDLDEIGTSNYEPDMAIICLVGQDFWKDPSLISRVFKALIDVPVRMISLGSSDINLSLVVPQKLLHNSIQKLHNEFF